MQLILHNISTANNVLANYSNLVEDHENSFKKLYENNATKITMICISVLFSVIVVTLSYGIIWYEKFGTDQKRTLMNKLVASLSWIMLEWHLFCQAISIIGLCFGPLPSIVCAFTQIEKTSIKFQLLLCINAMQIIRYFFIFHLKNPSAVPDAFWSLFINVWIIGFCNIYGFKLFFINGQKPVAYYTCIGSDVITNPNEYKRSYGGVEITTFIIYILIQLRIFQYKQQTEMQNQTLCLADSKLNSNSLSSFRASFFSTIALCTYTLMTIKVNSMKLLDIEVYPNYIYVQFYNLIGPNILAFMLTSVYYVTHPAITRALLQNLRDTFKPACQSILT